MTDHNNLAPHNLSPNDLSATDLETVDFNAGKSLKPWLKSIFEKESGRESRDFKLKAIDLELANSLCLNEVSLSKTFSKTLSPTNQAAKIQDEKGLRLYAYLIIKLSQALSRGEVCIELTQLYDMQQKTGIVTAKVQDYLNRFVTVHVIDVAGDGTNLELLSRQNPYDLVVNYPLVVMQGRLYFSRY